MSSKTIAKTRLFCQSKEMLVLLSQNSIFGVCYFNIRSEYEKKRIKAIKIQQKFYSVQNIQVFLSSANLYQQFIKSLNKIAASLILILKTIWSVLFTYISNFNVVVKPNNGKLIGVNTNISGNAIGRKLKNLSKTKNIEKLAEFKKPTKAKVDEIFKIGFFTLKSKVVFNQLRKSFTKVLIFCYFDLQYHIWIKTNVSNYANIRMLS